jgi:hypothetical protein
MTTTISLFVLAIVIALTNFAFALFILPESLPPSRRLSRASSSVDHHAHQGRKGLTRRITETMRHVTLQFLRPAALFIPLRLEGRRGRDWNLTLTGAALFLYVFADVSSIRVNVHEQLTTNNNLHMSLSKHTISNTFT